MSFGKAILALTVVVADSLACAFDISFALSGCVSPSFQQVVGAASPWFSVVGECASGRNLDKQNKNVTYETYKAPCLVAHGVGDWSGMAFVFCPRIVEGTDKLYAGTFSESSNTYIGEMATQFIQPVVSGDSSKSAFWLGTNAETSNVVFTISGHPYSRVRNLTSSSQTLNGVTILSGDERWLYLPVRLHRWPENRNDVQKYYLTDVNGNAIDYEMYTINSNYRGCCVYWSGDFDIREHGYPDDANTNLLEITEHLLYADIKGENEYKIMYGEDGELVCERLQIVSTNIALMTWWDFTQSEWDIPQAKINGVVVCPNHATSHIIPYTINNNRLVVNEMTGKGYFEFEMSQTPGNGISGGACTMRCWDASYGSSTSDYARTPAGHKAEIPAGLGVARFSFTVDIYKGTWKVEPL